MILRKIEKELQEKEMIKDDLFDAMRKATRSSKQAIFAVHKGKLKEARTQLKEATKLFAKRDELSQVNQELRYAGIVDAAFQEYAEAQIFLRLSQEGKFVGPEKLGVPSTSYLLGLADVVGELRRSVLDLLRKGDVKSAEENLGTMELIYDELIVMDKALHAVSRLRRKTDIARRIVEATRGDVTIEARRGVLERSLKKLERVLNTAKK